MRWVHIFNPLASEADRYSGHNSRVKDNRCFSRSLILLIIHAILIASASAEVRMPAIFGNHMVLQEHTTVPIWGWASPGEHVRVTFKRQHRQTVASAEGKWRVDLASVKPSPRGQTLTVEGEHNTLVFIDVLVGDIWVASGQSNMEFGIQEDARAKDAISAADDPQIRLFFVPWQTSLNALVDLSPVSQSSSLNGKWLVCNSAMLAADWGWHGFSAVGYYFAKQIRLATGNPVGIIGTYKGGTPAQAWVSLSGLQKSEALTHYVDLHNEIVNNFETKKAEYPAKQAAYQEQLNDWRAKPADGEKFPAPRPPLAPDGGYSAPSNLFNGMVAPLIPFAIKGVIWYQGESNGNNLEQANEYRVLFPILISDWREKWGQGDFPFLFVQLPNINAPSITPSEGTWPWVRDAQLKALSQPNTGMAVTIDLGEANNIHPPDKVYVGLRLALVARHQAYGEPIISTGPIYDSYTVDGNAIRLRFKCVGKGLTIGVPPPASDGSVLPLANALKGFGIAGLNQKFVWAKAKIDGDTVVVSSDDVEHPVAVRYDWGQNPPGNLYGENGLPASPFRTDDWPPTAPTPAIAATQH